MSVELYWISKTVVVEWDLKKPDGTAAGDATVTGSVALPPPGGSAVMSPSFDAGSGKWRLLYDPVAAGWHGFRLESVGTVDSAEGGEFYVKPSIVGAAPLQMDPTTDIGLVRLLIPDNDEDRPLFPRDEQITAFLTLEGGDVRKASAAALEVIASSEAMVSKKIRTQDLATDGPAVAKELRERAAQLRAQSDEAGAVADGGFDVVDFDPWAGYRSSPAVQ